MHFLLLLWLLFFVSFAVAAFVGGSSVVFLGDFFFFTWVHPFSLSGWSLASNWGFSFVGGLIVVVVVVLVVAVVVGGVIVVMVVF